MPSWCFNFSKKDWKKSDLSTCLGATQSASMSAPTNQNISYQEVHIMYHIFVKYTQIGKRKYVMIENASNN